MFCDIIKLIFTNKRTCASVSKAHIFRQKGEERRRFGRDNVLFRPLLSGWGLCLGALVY